MVTMGALDRHHVEQLWDRDDLIGLFRYLELPEHEALARCESRDHVNRLFRAFPLVGAAYRLAIDGDHVAGRASP
jgi:hypothetical protein